MKPGILSSFEDAAKSYELTWAIRLSSEQNSEKQRKNAVNGKANGV